MGLTLCKSCGQGSYSMFRVNDDKRYCERCFQRIARYGSVIGKSVIYMNQEEITKAFTIPLTRYRVLETDSSKAK